ncbi:MAG: hypothetical protein R3263_03680 [Myxococcota bacterium]|nr:hypothetical protein [Myxococcota bacterium]
MPGRDGRRARRPRRRRAVLCALLLAAAGCGREAPQAEPGPPPELARERLVALLTLPEERFGSTPEEAVRRLGAPAEREVTERPDPDDPAQQDRFHHLRWRGLELVFVETPGAEQAWLDRVHATAEASPSLGWPPGDLLGASEEEVAGWLGPPARREDGGDVWVYADPMAAAYVHVLLHFDDGRLAAVTWEAEAD